MLYFRVNKSKQPLTPNISAIPNFLWRGAACGIFLIQKNFEMFPLQPALTGGQESSKIFHKMLELPCALPQLRLCPKAPPMHREILWPG